MEKCLVAAGKGWWQPFTIFAVIQVWTQGLTGGTPVPASVCFLFKKKRNLENTLAPFVFLIMVISKM